METNQKFIRYPLGLILLIIITFVEIIKRIYGYFTDNTFFGFYQTGIVSIVTNTLLLILSVLALIILFTTSWKMIKWVVVYYIILIVNYVLLIINSSNIANTAKFSSGYFILINLLASFLSIISIWYLFEKKNLFEKKKDDNKSIEIPFVVTYLLFFIVTIVLSTLL